MYADAVASILRKNSFCISFANRSHEYSIIISQKIEFVYMSITMKITLKNAYI